MIFSSAGSALRRRETVNQLHVFTGLQSVALQFEDNVYEGNTVIVSIL
jgi:hypothetical protein